MRSIKEIKKRIGEEKISEIFGVSVEEIGRITSETFDDICGGKEICSKTETAIVIMEDVLNIKEYTSKDLLRLVMFVSAFASQEDNVPVAVACG